MEDEIKEEGTEESSTTDDSYQFDDDLSSSEPSATPTTQSNEGSGSYAKELFSKTIHAKFRTFYVDLKESRNGKFIKISEKSRGRKSTIMMDQEDIPAIIEALQEVQSKMN